MGDELVVTPPDEREERARRWRALQSTTAPSLSPPATPGPAPMVVEAAAPCTRCAGHLHQLQLLQEEFGRVVQRVTKAEEDKVVGGRQRPLHCWGPVGAHLVLVSTGGEGG